MKYVVQYEFTMKGLVVIEADSEDEALAKLPTLSRQELVQDLTGRSITEEGSLVDGSEEIYGTADEDGNTNPY